MEEILKKLKNVLIENDATCVISKNGEIYIDKQKGIRPLLGFISMGKNECYAADKVVGKAAAFLHVLLKTKALYADTISEPALEVLHEFELPVYYRQKVKMIMNKNNTDICPMEKAVYDISSPQKAYKKLIKVIATLKNNGVH